MFKVSIACSLLTVYREVHSGDRDRGRDSADDRCDEGSLSLAGRRHLRAVHQESEHTRDSNLS